MRDGSSGMYLPLVTSANVPEGSEFGRENDPHPSEGEMRFLGATPDLSHVLLSVAVGPAGVPVPPRSLYEWSAGRLTFVAGVGAVPGTEPSGDQGGGRSSGISSDGQRIVWWGAGGGGEGLYMTDTVEEKTVQVAGPLAVFQTMSSDGSEIFYLEEGELYAFDLQTEARTPLTAGHPTDELSGVFRTPCWVLVKTAPMCILWRRACWQAAVSVAHRTSMSHTRMMVCGARCT